MWLRIGGCLLSRRCVLHLHRRVYAARRPARRLLAEGRACAHHRSARASQGAVCAARMRGRVGDMMAIDGCWRASATSGLLARK